jgi:general secretion pathway protein E/type IV pilus assembly protein PilB
VLCPECKAEQPFDITSLPRNYAPRINPLTHHIAVGCEHCYYTGYKGRKAVYEVIPVTGEIAESIKKGTLNADLVKENMSIRFLHESAFELFCQGITSLEEIYPILLTGLY